MVEYSFAEFQKTVWDYYKTYGRKLPWRETEDSYSIAVSEIMLQQTQVPRVIEKYRSFIGRFPNWHALSRATIPQVLSEWQGLGYNRRGLYLKKMAETIVSVHNGKLPRTLQELIELPGIGKATAASISAFAFNIPTVFIETNVRSVFIHHFFRDRSDISDREIVPLIEKTVPPENPREWYWALMDYGTYLKKEHGNPSRKSAHHVRQKPFRGSGREARGAILKNLVTGANLSPDDLVLKTSIDRLRIAEALSELAREGFVVVRRGKYSLVK